MIPRHILKEIKRIEIRTNRLVNDLFGGEYESVFKGQGIEFADVREYIPGDDIRTIDWNVTARSERPFVKKYIEARELTVFFMVDGSGSQQFGTTAKFKSAIAAEICALLAFSAIRNNDKIGMVIFTDEVEKYVPIKKGRSHVLRVIREILYYQPKKKGTNIAAALEFLQHQTMKSAVVFLISDFQDTGFEKPLKIVSRKHDVIAIHLIDPREKTLPACGMIEMEDGETGDTMLVDTGSAQLQKKYACGFHEQEERLNHLFKSTAVDKVDIVTSASYTEPLIKLFRKREKRR